MNRNVGGGKCTPGKITAGIYLCAGLAYVYLMPPFLAGYCGYGDRYGPKIYPGCVHEAVFRIGWNCGNHVGKPRVSAGWKERDRPWFYGMSSANHTRQTPLPPVACEESR